MKLTHTKLALLVAVLALPMAAIGQDEQGSTEVATDDGAMDNIVVVGQKSHADLRRDLWQFEDDFYNRYNKLNDEARYDVRCAHEAETGSRIKKQICRPQFLAGAISSGKVNKVTNLVQHFLFFRVGPLTYNFLKSNRLC